MDRVLFISQGGRQPGRAQRAGPLPLPHLSRPGGGAPDAALRGGPQELQDERAGGVGPAGAGVLSPQPAASGVRGRTPQEQTVPRVTQDGS